MPQLDVASYLPQVVWLAITFAILYLLMAKVALPRISNVLEERSERRQDNLAKAEELQAEAEAAAEAYEKVLADAHGAAHERVLKSTDEAKTRTEAAIHELDQKLAGEVNAAEAAVNAARADALKDATAIAAEAARLAAGRLAGIEVEAAAAEAAARAAQEARV
jgi:F-type H+-transporting ATPase subunit b